MTDAAGRTVTREHPEHILLKQLEERESLRDVLEHCIWVLDEIGYKKLAKAATKRLEEAIDEAARVSLKKALTLPEEDHGHDQD